MMILIIITVTMTLSVTIATCFNYNDNDNKINIVEEKSTMMAIKVTIKEDCYCTYTTKL